MLEDIHEHPDLAQIGQGHDLFGRCHVHALANTEHGDNTIRRCQHGNQVAGFPVTSDVSDGLLGHTEQTQAVARLVHGGAGSPVAVLVQRDQVIHLRTQHLGGIKGPEHIPSPNRVSLGPHAELFHPALGTRMNMGEARLVVHHPTHGTYVFPEGLSGRPGGAHPHALDDFPADGHSGPLAGTGVHLPGHQIHSTDRASGRFVTHDLRMHRADVFRVQVLERMLRGRVVERLGHRLGGGGRIRAAATGQQDGEDQGGDAHAT